jgi:hypothetical protein
MELTTLMMKGSQGSNLSNDKILHHAKALLVIESYFTLCYYWQF